MNLEKYRIYHGKTRIGTLYRETNGKMSIEFVDGLSLYNVPALFYGKYRKGERTFTDQQIIKNWVESRGFDPGRMNINEIKRDLKMSVYDPWKVFKHYNGRVANDSYRVERER